MANAAVPPEARPYQGAPAGLVSRSLAALVDALVVGTLAVACLAGANVLAYVLHPVGFRPVALTWPALLTGSLALAVGYLTVAWSTTGRSYGCRLMGLRVVDSHHRVPGVAVAWLRAVVCVAFPLGLVWCALGSRRAAVHDLLLRTRVVYDWMPRAFSDRRAHP
jgi:uncharacterized RDD family membrane protein YckC